MYHLIFGLSKAFCLHDIRCIQLALDSGEASLLLLKIVRKHWWPSQVWHGSGYCRWRAFTRILVVRPFDQWQNKANESKTRIWAIWDTSMGSKWMKSELNVRYRFIRIHSSQNNMNWWLFGKTRRGVTSVIKPSCFEWPYICYVELNRA